MNPSIINDLESPVIYTGWLKSDSLFENSYNLVLIKIIVKLIIRILR